MVVVKGFTMCFILYMVMAASSNKLIDTNNGPLLLILYGLSFFFNNFGPGATTFLLPAKVFPLEIKATLNGIAAASGKIGE